MIQAQPRIYIQFAGARLWCVPWQAMIGHSIVTRCNGRAYQREAVQLATDPPEELRCTACELAANESDESGRRGGQ